MEPRCSEGEQSLRGPGSGGQLDLQLLCAFLLGCLSRSMILALAPSAVQPGAAGASEILSSLPRRDWNFRKETGWWGRIELGGLFETFTRKMRSVP